MGAAIGFAIMIIVLGVFLPDILNAIKELILIVLEKAIMYTNTL